MAIDVPSWNRLGRLWLLALVIAVYGMPRGLSWTTTCR